MMLATVIGAPARGGGWYVEGGPAYRGGMTVKVEGSSYVQLQGRHAVSGPLALPAGVGAADQYADRLYSDGYVKIDAGTLNPDAVGGPGNTWNWAYDQGGQFDSAGQTLSFHSTGERGYAPEYNGTAGLDGEMSALGLQLAFGVRLKETERWSLDLGLGVQAVWEATLNAGTTAYVERTARLHVTDAYNVAATMGPGGEFPLPRTVAGGYVGGYDEPGPVMGNLPGQRGVQREEVSVAENTVNYRVRADVYQITLRPRWRYQLSQRVSFQLTPQLGVAVVDAGVDRQELFTETAGGTSVVLNQWSDHDDSCQARFVGGISGGIDLELGRGFYAGVYGGYDWVVDPVKLTAGPNEVRLDTSGYVVGGTLGWRF